MHIEKIHTEKNHIIHFKMILDKKSVKAYAFTRDIALCAKIKLEDNLLNN